MIRRMTQTQETKARPMWASAIAVGLLIAGVGALLFMLGMIAGGILGVLGGGVFALGLAFVAFGGYIYFIGVRR